MSRYQAVIFDLDGTLLQSNIDFVRIRSELGVPDEESILDFLEGLGEADRERGQSILDRIEREAALEATVLSGAREVLAWLDSVGVPYGILTRNSRATWEIVIKKFPFLSTVFRVTRDCAPPKPAEQSLLPFFQEWGLIPERMIHVGDFRYDLELAAKCGMYSILLNGTGKNPYGVGCDRVVRDHGDLLSHFKELWSTDFA